MVQNMANEEIVFEKLNELNYEGLIVIAKVLNFKEQDSFLCLKWYGSG